MVSLIYRIPLIDACLFNNHSNILFPSILYKGIFPIGLPAKLLQEILPLSCLYTTLK
jgi:hypothetical protein